MSRDPRDELREMVVEKLSQRGEFFEKRYGFDLLAFGAVIDLADVVLELFPDVVKHYRDAVGSWTSLQLPFPDAVRYVLRTFPLDAGVSGE